MIHGFLELVHGFDKDFEFLLKILQTKPNYSLIQFLKLVDRLRAQKVKRRNAFGLFAFGNVSHFVLKDLYLLDSYFYPIQPSTFWTF